MDNEFNPADKMNAEFDLKDAFSTNDSPPAEELKVEEVVTEPEKKEDPFSVKFAALSRREKQLRQQEKELNRRMQELESKNTVNAPKEEAKAELPPLEYRLKKDPLGTLKEMGFTYDKLAELVSNDGKLPQDMQLELLRQELDDKYNKEIQSIKDELLNRDKKSEEERLAQTIENFKSELSSFVDTNPEEYEQIKANDAVDTVYELIEQHYQDTGNILSNKEAADAVESFYFERAKNLYENSKKFKNLNAQPTQQVKPSSPTLSNNQSKSFTESNNRKLTEDQSKFEASKHLKWIE